MNAKERAKEWLESHGFFTGRAVSLSKVLEDHAADAVKALLEEARKSKGDVGDLEFPTRERMREEIWAQKARAEAAEKFKAFVHRYLDDAGVPHEIDDKHLKAGCRIGGRLDFVLSGKATAESKVKELLEAFKENRDAEKQAWARKSEALIQRTSRTERAVVLQKIMQTVHKELLKED